eukprot:5724982-Prymnesium_polylepis.1
MNVDSVDDHIIIQIIFTSPLVVVNRAPPREAGQRERHRRHARDVSARASRRWPPGVDSSGVGAMLQGRALRGSEWEDGAGGPPCAGYCGWSPEDSCFKKSACAGCQACGPVGTQAAAAGSTNDDGPGICVMWSQSDPTGPCTMTLAWWCNTFTAASALPAGRELILDGERQAD